MANIIKKSGRIFLLLILILYSVRLVIGLSQGVSQSTYGWDFHPYYFGAKAYQDGLNPYLLENLNQEAGQNIIFAFAYPPPSLWFFSPFTLLPYPAAAQAWLFLKVVLIIILVILWRKYFSPAGSSLLFYLMLLFAFDAAAYWDLKSGNVAVIEQFFLWMAFLYLLKKRPLAFCVFTFLASIFKVTPILFLGLLPLSTLKNRWKYFIGASAAFVALTAICFVVFPNLMRSYISSMSIIRERAPDFNYSLLPFFKDVSQTLGSLVHATVPNTIPWIVYILTAVGILGITAKALRWKSPAGIGRDPRLLIMLACVVYVLLVPRIKCYSYIILIAPAFYIMMEYVSARAYAFIFLLLIIPVHNPLPESALITQYRLYYLLYLTVALWILYLFYIHGEIDSDKGNYPAEHPRLSGGRSHT